MLVLRNGSHWKISKTTKIVLMLSLVISILLCHPLLANATGLGELKSENFKVKNATNKDGFVIGALSTEKVYAEPDIDSKQIGITYKDVIRAVGKKKGFYKIKYGTGYAYVNCDDFLEGDELTDWILSDPFYARSIRVTAKEADAYDPFTGEWLMTMKKGEEYQIFDYDDQYFTVILPEDIVEDPEAENLAAVKIDDAKLLIRLTLSNFKSDVYYGTYNSDLIEYACQFVGNPYVWGGTDPNVGADCSGFMQYVFKHFGVNLPRTAAEQVNVGKTVKANEMRPGDLIFYYRSGRGVGHVAMYIGGGKMVHAKGRNYGIVITELDRKSIAGIKRML